jgi:hypothetical protein
MTVLAGPYPSRHFTLAELSCPATGEYYHDPEFLWRLEELRAKHGGTPLFINSAHRSPTHNAAVGGAPLSQHKKMAVDISLRNIDDPAKLRRLAIECGFLGIGMARTFLHLDLRRPINGVRFPTDRLTQWYYGTSREFWKDKI